MSSTNTVFSKFFIVVIVILLSGCGSVSVTKKSSQDAAPTKNVDVSKIPNAIPRNEPKSRYGNPESYVVFGKRYYVMESSKDFVEQGIASWYGTKFHGRRTSSGETYDMYAMTAAHKNLPLPTYVKVTNLNNGKHIIVKVNDRGPFHENRIIDLSYTAALKLDIVKKGTGLVKVVALEPGQSVNSGPSAPVVTPTAVNTSEPSFYIQVGSFGQRSNAENLKSKLTNLDSNLVSISETIISGNTFYRVRVGPLTNIGQADDVVNELTSLGITDHQIVLNE
ncbi:MAG: septal ring lytic transglycosylase RlpA family protein [Pseudomonadota bacterium]